ncbi:MAG: type II toxin-antitoxin system death-on-curing family toxin [Pseudomonadota bacterium]
MTLRLLSADLVITIHDAVLNPGELAGLALDKSLEGALGRVDNRMAYGMIEDAFDLAAAYAVAIATGHCFNDANKRTAFRSMQTALWLNDVPILFEVEDIGPIIIEVAQGKMDEAALADWLRGAAAEAIGDQST